MCVVVLIPALPVTVRDTSTRSDRMAGTDDTLSSQ